MEEETLKNSRWKVMGFYKFVNTDPPKWELDRKYWIGNIEWEFGDETITCLKDGIIEHVIQYRIIEGPVLMISFPVWSPYYSVQHRKYLIMRRPSDPTKRRNELWLYDKDVPGPRMLYLAIRLVPVK